MDYMVIGKALIIIQARMNSERLPGKVMQKIGNKPMIGYLFDRLKEAHIDILLATSNHKENDILVDYAIENGIKTFRGSENNVLERFYLAARENSAQVIIRITGDNPLTDGELLRKEVNKYIERRNEYLYRSTGRSKTFPLGISFEIFSYKLLEEAFKNATVPGEIEHVTPYIHQNKNGRTIIEPIKYSKNRNYYRLTVDTPSDFQLIKELILKYNCHKKNVDEIVAILDANPELAQMNHNVEQKKWDA